LRGSFLPEKEVVLKEAVYGVDYLPLSFQFIAKLKGRVVKRI
jgi:hypothetical protein